MRKLGQQKLGDLPMLHTANTRTDLNSCLLSPETALRPPAAGSLSESLAGEGKKCQYDFIGDKSQRSPGNRDVTAISPFNIRGNVAFAKSSAGLAQKSAQKTGSRFLDLEQKQERATVVWKVSGLGD